MNRSLSFGEILQQRRQVLGLTQEELAERARLSARAISDLERGVKTRPHLATIRQLAEALELSPPEREELQRAARGLASRRRAGEWTIDAESTVHTFLIADVRGYTRFTLEHGDAEAALLTARFAQVVQETVSAWDGTLIEVRGDEVLAVFTSARRALQAAVDLQTRLSAGDEAFQLGVGIGLDAGEAVAVGGGYRGAALNLAARLCSIAQAGEVLASEGVLHLARKVDGLKYIDRGPAQLKGFRDPVNVSVITADSQVAPPQTVETVSEAGQRLPVGGFLGSLPSSPLVARRAEVEVLLRVLQEATQGEGKLVLIAGEPGIGKTRLAQEVTASARDRDFLTAAGRCYQPQESVPYFPFLDALGTVYAAATAAIRDEAAHRWPYLARLLPDVLGSSAAPSSGTPEEQERLFRAVSGFLLTVAASRPVALLLDDLHWADSASLQLLQHLARQVRTGRVLLLGTYRDVEVHPDHPLEAALRDLSREQAMVRVALKRLSETDTSSFITQLMGELDDMQDFTALVHRHTDGNPFFTQQVVHALMENGSVYQQEGRWIRRTVQDIDVPESVRSVIAQRVARLQPEAQGVLQEASVLGQTFRVDDLLNMKAPADLTADVEIEVDEALAQAASFGLIRESGRDQYVFDHALTQQALYATISPRRRRRMHLAAGESMERQKRGRNQRAGELAWHFLQGDNEELAIRYSVLAGDQAESVFAHGEAERHYRMALELAQDTEDAAGAVEVLEKLGGVLKIVGRYDEARDVLERAATHYQSLDDLQGQGRVAAQIGLLCHLSGVPEAGIRRLQPLAAALEPLGPSHSLALLYAALVRLFDHIGRQDEQFDASRRLLELARGLADERLLAEAELHQGVSLIHRGRYEDALGLLESAIPRAERLGDLHTVCIALGFCAVLHHGQHRVDQAMLYHARAVEVAERLGDPREIAHRAVEAAYFTFLVGDWTRARVYAERAVTSALDLDSLHAFLQPLYTLGELSLYTGAAKDGFGYLGECTTIAQHLGLADHHREVQALLAEYELLEDQPAAALSRLSPLLESPGWEEHMNFLLVLAATRLETGDFTGAEEAITRVVADATRQRLPIALVDALRIQGAIAGRRHAWEEADLRLDRAIELARSVTYPWGEARARYESGLAHARRGLHARARHELAAASAIFHRLGAAPYQAKVDAALAGVRV